MMMCLAPRISFKVEFIKSVGFLKGAIEGGAIGNTKKLLQVWVSMWQWRMLSYGCLDCR